MSEPSRIELVSAVETVPRQTPKRDFGEVLNQTLSNVVNRGISLMRSAVASLPMLSTAVAGVQSVSGVVGAVQTPIPPSGRGTGTATTPGLPALASSSPSLDSVMQRLQSGAELSSTEYLVVQQAIQQESQQYTALSNILKVRSDSARAAINNIR
jgi:hypothetical protein